VPPVKNIVGMTATTPFSARTSRSSAHPVFVPSVNKSRMAADGVKLISAATHAPVASSTLTWIRSPFVSTSEPSRFMNQLGSTLDVPSAA